MNALIFTSDAIPTQRFRAQVEAAPNGCLIWSGPLDRDGYGRYRWRSAGRQFATRAHRVAWVLAGRQLLPGLVLDHLCRNRRCVNVDHMDQVTVQVNTARGTGPTAATAMARLDGRCINDHVLAVVGTHKQGSSRTCAECGRQRVARYKARRRALAVSA